jgi:hypothetical protein
MWKQLGIFRLCRNFAVWHKSTILLEVDWTDPCNQPTRAQHEFPRRGRLLALLICASAWSCRTGDSAAVWALDVIYAVSGSCYAVALRHRACARTHDSISGVSTRDAGGAADIRRLRRRSAGRESGRMPDSLCRCGQLAHRDASWRDTCGCRVLRSGRSCESGSGKVVKRGVKRLLEETQ